MHDAIMIPNQRVLNEFAKWIELPCFDRQHAASWNLRYLNDREAAMCEATVWAILRDSGVDVQPVDLTGSSPAPDFRCTKDGAKFYVEVTCIEIDTATDGTGLQPNPNGVYQRYRHMNDLIFKKCVRKTPQCANLDAPCLLAVGTFHHQASALCVKKVFMEWLLTGEASLAWNVDTQSGQAFGESFQVTSFSHATFTRLRKPGVIESARKSISALLVAGLGCDPVKVFGLLHPTPARAFEPGLLERIPFCRQRIDSVQGAVSAEWIQTSNEWEKRSA